MNLKEKMQSYSSEVEEYILDYIGKGLTVLNEPCAHYIKAGGKRLRPFLLLKCFQLFNKSTTAEILPIASAIEIFHTFTLIHDDIMDNDETRRGVVSVHEKWGTPFAILSGDILYGMSAYITALSDISIDIKLKIIEEMGILNIRISEGQALDILFEKRTNVLVEEYIEMIKLKTAILFNKSAKIGGLLASASKKEIESLVIFGENLGLAFQIIDDILGITSNFEEIGKPLNSDIVQGKKSYPILYALSNLPPQEKEVLENILYNESNKIDILEAKRLIFSSGAIEHGRKKAEIYIQKACDELNKFNDCEAKDDLLEITKLCTYRKN